MLSQLQMPVSQFVDFNGARRFDFSVTFWGLIAQMSFKMCKIASETLVANAVM